VKPAGQVQYPPNTREQVVPFTIKSHSALFSQGIKIFAEVSGGKEDDSNQSQTFFQLTAPTKN
jgi:hypothetical protein